MRNGGAQKQDPVVRQRRARMQETSAFVHDAAGSAIALRSSTPAGAGR